MLDSTPMSENTIKKLLSLPPGERLRLAQLLWESVADKNLPYLSEADRQMLDRRLADDDANPEGRVSWDAARAEIEAELRKL